MNAYEISLLARCKEHFSAGEPHYAFDLPDDPVEQAQLKNALATLEDANEFIVLASPWHTGDDYIEVEVSPSGYSPK